MKKRTIVIYVSIFFMGMILFVTGLGSVHLFDWDEINFAESSREMIVTGNYLDVQVNFEPFWEKPPLFVWMQTLCMKALGVNEMAARLPNAVAGIITLMVLFGIGRRLRDDKFGLLWAVLYVSSFLPFLYFKTGIIDPWFNLFIFLGIYFFSQYAKDCRMRYAALSAACIGLGILTKGPVAFLIFGLTFLGYLVYKRFSFRFRWKDVAVYCLVLAVVGGAWFILQIASGNFSIVRDFIVYQIRLFETKDAGHGGFLLYHFVVLLLGVFPASFLALPAFRFKVLQQETNRSMADFFSWMMISFWVVLILFTIVRTKIVHYSSFCYFPLTFIAAYEVSSWLEGKSKCPKYVNVLLLVGASLYALLMLVITLFDKIKPWIYPYVKDAYTRNSMTATADWIGVEPLIGLVLLFSAIGFVICFRKEPSAKHLSVLLVGCVLFIFSTTIMIPKQVEKYSQESAIEFYISKQSEDCYIYSREKSYAQYFYSDRQPSNKCTDFDFLAQGPIDKTCYFVSKNKPHRVQPFIEKIKDVEKLYEKEGYVFYVRYSTKH